RMASPRGTAFAAAMRMIDGIHRHATIMRSAAKPAGASGLAQGDIHMVGVGYRADGCETLAVDQPLLPGIQADDDIAFVTADDLRIGAGRTRHRGTLADLHLYIMDDCADWDIGERHRIAGLHVGLRAGNHFVASRQALRRDDVGDVAVGITNKRNEGRPVGIIFDPLHFGRNIELTPFEVDDPVTLLVAAAAKPHGNAAIVITPAARRLPLGQLLERLTLIKTRAIDDDELAKT